MADYRTSNREHAGQQRGWRIVLASPLLHLQVLLVLALLLGGGGVGYGLRNLAIQLLALLLLAVHGPLVARFWREAGWGLRLLVLASLVVPLVQLIPLPPHLWQALPGREAVLASHRIAGWGEDQWCPISMDRARTLVAFTGLIAPTTIVMLGTCMPDRHKATLALTMVVATFGSFLWGLLQLQSANQAGLLFPINPQPGVLYATFGNRNSTGLLFGAATALLIGLANPQRTRELFGLAVMAVLLVSGVFLTQSRSSMVLLAAPLALLLLRLGWLLLARGRPRGTTTEGMRWAVALATGLTVLVALGIGWSATHGGRVATSLARFDDRQTDRPEMWEDGIYAAGQYWPVGSGMGTFDEVFQLHESLEYVSLRRAGRAHSDYVELAIEAGPFGLALALGWLGWCLACCWGQFRRGPNWPALGAGVAAGAVALQSLIDYPLRNQTLLCVAGLLVVLLAIRRTGAGAVR